LLAVAADRCWGGGDTAGDALGERGWWVGCCLWLLGVLRQNWVGCWVCCGEVFVGGAALAVAAHNAFAADHGVRDVFGAEALWQTALFAHWAEAGVVSEESVYTFWVEDVVAR
jgi:hypothetical protein